MLFAVSLTVNEGIRLFDPMGKLISHHQHTVIHYTAKIVKITNLLVSIVARNSINFNVVGHTGYCGYMHDVTMTLCVLSF